MHRPAHYVVRYERRSVGYRRRSEGEQLHLEPSVGVLKKTQLEHQILHMYKVGILDEPSMRFCRQSLKLVISNAGRGDSTSWSCRFEVRQPGRRNAYQQVMICQTRLELD